MLNLKSFRNWRQSESPAKMVNFIEGYVVLAYKEKFVYFKVETLLGNEFE